MSSGGMSTAAGCGSAARFSWEAGMDDQDERMFLLRLGRDERKILYAMLERFRVRSKTTAIRTCIRAMGERMNLQPEE